MKPFLKWAGGKGALLHEILPRLPSKINTYYEPFLGGGAVFFALASEARFKRAILSDANEELALTYGTLRDFPDPLVQVLKRHVYDEDHYYAVRGINSKKLGPPARAARFIYLNRTCFNGLYRVNKKGEFNVPFGRYTNPTICDEPALRLVSASLQSIAICSIDFEMAVMTAERRDAVYFDPPYVPLSETSNFTAYSKGGFGEADHVRLRDCFAALDKKGVHVLLSNSDTPFVRKLYKGFKIEKVEAPRRVNSKASKRGNVSELLISGRNRA
jgi:DNA adenine methylase